MKAEELTIEVNAKLNVDPSTANACLKMVEIFLNANKELQLKNLKLDNGETVLSYELT